MKAVSLWQPWASAIALRFKLIETRGWSTRYRGFLAIHAAKRWTVQQQTFARDARALAPMPEDLPFGAIVAVARLVDVKRTEELLASGVPQLERLYGDYGAGRYGWLLEDVRPLEHPVPWRGSQGFFEVPDEAVAR